MEMGGVCWEKCVGGLGEAGGEVTKGLCWGHQLR